jgi:serine/threonine protein kinase
MYGEKMAEKNIFPSLRREIKILHKILKIEGCIHFTDIIMDENSLSIVFPYYINGDLYKFSNPVNKPVEESVA